MIETEINYLLSFLWAFTISVFAIPSIIQIAHQKNLLDEPNFRTMHASLTPRLGGLAIFAGFISAMTIFGQLSHDVQRVLAGAMLLFFIGLKDDIVSISAFKKFFVQILATGIIIFMGDIRITNFQGFLGIYQLDVGISYGFTFLVIVGITNAINLIDGLDGLAGSITMIVSATFGIYFYLMNREGYAQLAFSLMGGVVGFLRYNIHKAIIFMGDTGSLVCGFLVSVLAIQFVEMQQIDSAPSITVAILFVPVFDTVRVFAIRILKGKSPFSPDKSHIHHILSAAGLSQINTVITLIIVKVLIIISVILLSYMGDNVLLLSLVAFFVVSAIFLQLLDRFNRKRSLFAGPASSAGPEPAIQV
jgi:UDP-GlcNAc:undecaprenyl-phosphate/decaprenyl-phosphate GlcNAc-1-phosphate transferase